jgi:tripartite ATP-independent transporter DctP family solute receptor
MISIASPWIVASSLALIASFLGIFIWAWRSGNNTQRPPAASVSHASAPPQVLRLGHSLPEDSELHQAAQRYAEDVAGKSAGRLRITVLPAQSPGNDEYLLEQARNGELDLLLTPLDSLAMSAPAMQYAELPFYFPEPAAFHKLLDDEPGQMLLGKLKGIGLVGLAFWDEGFRQFSANRPIRQPQDFAGLKLRTDKSPLATAHAEAYGAQPTPVEPASAYQALAYQAIDAQESALPTLVGRDFHKVQSHLLLSHHAYQGYVLSLSLQRATSLSAPWQQWLVDCAREQAAAIRETNQAQEAHWLDSARQAGMDVHELGEAERHSFAEATRHLADQFEDSIGADLIAKTEEWLYDQRQRTAPSNEILIGLDADLSGIRRADGLAIKRAMKLAVEEINQAGGVLGRPLAILARDHQSAPNRGIADLREFASRSQVAAVMGGQSNAVLLESLPIAQAHSLPLLVPWATAAAIVENGEEPNVAFRVSANDRLAGAYLAEQAARQHQRIALLLEDSAWGQELEIAMAQRLAELGLASAATVWFEPGERQWDERLQAIAAAEADSLLLAAQPKEGSAIVEHLAKQANPLSVFSHWAIVGGNFWQRTQTALETVDLRFFQTFSFHGNPSPKAQELLNRYHQAYSRENAVAEPTAAAAQAYDLMQLLALAIQRAGGTDRQTVREALEHLPAHAGLVKHYAPPFAPGRHDALNAGDYHLARYAEDGRIVAVAE